MKRCLFLFCCAVAALAAGCSSEGTSTTAEPQPVTLFADIEQPASPTRLSLKAGEGDGVYDLVWSEADEIAVIGTEGGTPRTSRFTLASGSGTTKGAFSGTLSDSGEAPYYAVFPYRSEATLADGSLSFPIPQRVQGWGGNIAQSALPAVARVAVNGAQAGVALRNIFGLLKLTFTCETSLSVKKIVLHDLGGNMLWGNCRVPIVAGEPDYGSISLTGGSNTLALTWNIGTTFSGSAKSVYFPVPPGALDRGFSLVLYERDDDQVDSVGRAWTFLQKISSPVAAGRSTIVEIDAATLTEKSEKRDVKERGYYKSLFVDGGIYLTSNDSTNNLPAIEYLELQNDYEYFGSSVNDDYDGADRNVNLYTQNGVMVSAPAEDIVTWNDANGVLVYPDGEPRFRCIYVNGGKSTTHGSSLGEDGRNRVRTFYANGGGYVGTCAGCLISSRGYDSYAVTTSYFGIWPGHTYHTKTDSGKGVSNTYTSMTIEPGSPLLNYYDYGGDMQIDNVRHNGGCYMGDDANYPVPDGTEILLRYLTPGPDSTKLNGQVSSWAYKASDESGRLVVIGSHPESVNSGERRDLFSAMLRYAMDGNGNPVVKTGDLTLGATRTMNLSTSDDDPAHTRIGDRQYHHFRFVAASDIEDFMLTLGSDYGPASGVNLYLALRKDGLAWLSDADYVLCNSGGQKTISVKNLPAGTWYVSVYCATTVTATPTEIPTNSSKIAYWDYSGHTEVLDGIAYTLKIGIQRAGSLSPYSGTHLGTDSFDD